MQFCNEKLFSVKEEEEEEEEEEVLARSLCPFHLYQAAPAAAAATSGPFFTGSFCIFIDDRFREKRKKNGKASRFSLSLSAAIYSVLH
jgi:hypothetical protein